MIQCPRNLIQMYAVIITYKVPLTEIDQALDEHIEWLDRYYENGSFLASGRREPRNGGVILVRDQLAEPLDWILKKDPFHHQGLANHEVIEFHPSKLASELEQYSELFS